MQRGRRLHRRLAHCTWWELLSREYLIGSCSCCQSYCTSSGRFTFLSGLLNMPLGLYRNEKKEDEAGVRTRAKWVRGADSGEGQYPSCPGPIHVYRGKPGQGQSLVNRGLIQVIQAGRRVWRLWAGDSIAKSQKSLLSHPGVVWGEDEIINTAVQHNVNVVYGREVLQQ